MSEHKRPKVSNSAQQELDKVEKQFEEFDSNIKEMTLDRMNMAPKQETEPHKLSQLEIEKSNDIYLKPSRAIFSPEKFNEKFREDYNFSKEYVRFIPKNEEIKGDIAEFWTKPFPGTPAEFWKVPVDKPVWAPRYVAERMKNCSYHKLVMQQNVTNGNDYAGQYYGALAVDTTVQRLDAIPVTNKKSIFMGATGF